jgi:hypothetical protein
MHRRNFLRSSPKLVKQMTALPSWTDDPDIRHFSGTAGYELEFEVPAGYLGKSRKLILDLGTVAGCLEGLGERSSGRSNLEATPPTRGYELAHTREQFPRGARQQPLD